MNFYQCIKRICNFAICFKRFKRFTVLKIVSYRSVVYCYSAIVYKGGKFGYIKALVGRGNTKIRVVDSVGVIVINEVGGEIIAVIKTGDMLAYECAHTVVNKGIECAFYNKVIFINLNVEIVSMGGCGHIHEDAVLSVNSCGYDFNFFTGL